ncbi:hypothetical protein F5Y07DRAFT_365368 [Xylaria sp. FL0933]|nr:hypothetical protein F5Y07DRAFT_365368 [Xylaria sp. FL0933]
MLVSIVARVELSVEEIKACTQSWNLVTSRELVSDWPELFDRLAQRARRLCTFLFAAAPAAAGDHLNSQGGLFRSKTWGWLGT